MVYGEPNMVPSKPIACQLYLLLLLLNPIRNGIRTKKEFGANYLLNEINYKDCIKLINYENGVVS